MSEQQPKKSDLSRAFSEDGTKKTHIGGQALIEGIMMRGKLNWAVAVRTPDGGIYVEEHDLASGKQKNGWMYWPLVRGCRALVESLVLGFKALEIAALHAFGDEEGEEEALAQAQTVEVQEELDAAGAVALSEEKRFDWKRDFGNPDTMVDGLGAQRTLEVVQGPEGVASKDVPEGAEAAAKAAPGEGDAAPCKVREVAADEPEAEFGHREMVFSMVFGVVLGVVLFIVAPAVITNLLVGEYDGNPVVWNVVDGILRVAVFVFYLWLIGRMEDIRRMFMYHGAEHKALLPRLPHHGDDHCHFGVHHLSTELPHRRLGRAGGAAQVGAGHLGAHPADAGDCRHLLRDNGALGRLAPGQSPGESGAVARHADAVPHHQRTGRSATGMRHRRHGAGAGAGALSCLISTGQSQKGNREAGFCCRFLRSTTLD